MIHDTYIRWYLRNRCALTVEYILFDLFKAFYQNEISQKIVCFLSEKTFFLHACATCYELPSNINTMKVYLSQNIDP